MEGAESKSSINGIEGREVAVLARTPSSSSSSSSAGVLIVRFIALLLTLVATILIGVDKQTKIVPIKIIDTLPPLNVPVTAKWHYLSALIYFLVANAIACAYAALSIVASIANRGKSKGLGTLITLFDAIMVALLFSGNGAATAVGVLGYQGNSHVQWNKVCNVFGKFCHQMAASILVSLLGSIAFFFLMLIPAFRLHRKTY